MASTRFTEGQEDQMRMEIVLPDEAAAEALAKFELGVMLGLVGDDMNRAMRDRRLSGTIEISGQDVAEWHVIKEGR